MKSCLLTLVLFLHSLIISAQGNLTQYIDSIMKSKEIPGLTWTVLRSDTILSKGVKGIRSIETKTPMQMGDFMHLGSNTKAITSFIAARMVDQGLIRWNTKAVELFPSWKDSIHKAHLLTSLADLLCHRAGILAFTSGTEFLGIPSDVKATGPSRRAFSKWLLQNAPINKTSGIVYSNAGYSIAALMLEKASGKSWERLVKELLQTSMKLKYYKGWPYEIDKKQPLGHWKVRDSLVAVTQDYDYNLLDCIAPASDISMPVEEYGKFVQNVLKEAIGKNTLLKPETAQYMLYQIPEYSMGWGWSFVDGISISFHDGSAGTFFCHSIFYKEADLAVIVLANSGEQSAQQGVYEIEKRLSKDFWTIKPEDH